MMMMPDSPGKWRTFALGPVSKSVWVHIAFDGPVTEENIKKAMLYLESALDWAPPERGLITPDPLPLPPEGVVTPSTPLDETTSSAQQGGSE